MANSRAVPSKPYSMAVPPIEFIRIEAELASIKSMLETLTETKQEEEQQKEEQQIFAIVPPQFLQHHRTVWDDDQGHQREQGSEVHGWRRQKVVSRWGA